MEMFSDLGFFEIDPKGKVRDWSDAASRLLGVPSDEVIGRSISDLGVKLEGDANFASLEVAAREGRSETFGWVVRKDGSRFWANEVTLAVRDGSGQISGYATVIRDVTSWKLAEDDLDRFFELSADLIAIAGFDGFFKRVNPAFKRVLGYPEAELVSKPFVHFIHPDDVAATNKEAADLAAGSNHAALVLKNVPVRRRDLSLARMEDEFICRRSTPVLCRQRRDRSKSDRAEA